MSTMSKSRKALIGVGLAAASMFGAACQVVPPSNAALVQDVPSTQGRASILGLRKIGHSSAGRTNTWCGPEVNETVNGLPMKSRMCESSVGGGLLVGRETFHPIIDAWTYAIGVWDGNGQICGGTVSTKYLNSNGELPVTCR